MAAAVAVIGAAAGGTMAALSGATILAGIGQTLAIVGMVTGNEELGLIGGVMGMAGGISGVVGGGASAAGGVASTATEAAATAAAEGGNIGTMLAEQTAGMDLAGWEGATQADMLGAQTAGMDVSGWGGAQPGDVVSNAASDLASSAAASPDTSVLQDSITQDPYAPAHSNRLSMSGGSNLTGPVSGTNQAYAGGSRFMPQGTGLPQSQGVLGGVTDWMRQNPELTKMGGEMLKGMFKGVSPDVDAQVKVRQQMLDEERRQFDAKMGLLKAAQIHNLKSGVAPNPNANPFSVPRVSVQRFN